MKKVLVVLICIACLCLLISLIACQGNSGNGGSTNTGTDTSTSTDTSTNQGGTGGNGGGNTQNPTVATGVIVPVVKYLRISSLEDGKVAIRFNAIGKNLNYEIRYSANEITAENFENATLSQAVVVGNDEVKTAVINEISAGADSKYFVAVRASNTNGIDTEYSEVLCVRAGGIELVKVDMNRIDAFYMGEVIKDASKLIDEQSIADPYHNIPGIPISKVSKYYWAKNELNPGSFVPHNSTHAKHGIILRPIIDLETEHYIDSIYLYYGMDSYPVQVNVSLDAANYDTLEDWDYSVSYTVDKLISSELIKATLATDSKVLSNIMYNGKNFTLVKENIGLNGTYVAKSATGLELKIALNKSSKTAEFFVIDQNGATVTGGYAKYPYEVDKENDKLILYTGTLDKDDNPVVLDSGKASVSIDWYGNPSSASFKLENGQVVKATLDEVSNAKTSIYHGKDTQTYTLEMAMSQVTNTVEFKLLVGGKTVENGKVEFEFVIDNGEVKLYRKGQTDDDGNKIPVPTEFATITLDSTTGLPKTAFFAIEQNKKNPDGTNVKDENDKFVFEYKDGTTYYLDEKFSGESGTYIGTDDNGNASLKLILDGKVKDYKPATFIYTDPTTNEQTTFTCIYVIEGGKIKFCEDNRPMKQGWTKVEIGREVRYIQICYKDTEDYHGSVSSQAPTEVLIYGYATGAGDKIVDTSHPLPLIKDFMGACGFTAGGGGNTSPRQLECFGVLREYVNLGWVYSNAGFPKKAATIANSSMGDFDKNYGRDYAALTVIPCLQWNEGSNPARYYDRITGTLDISQIASEADKFKPETYAAYADVAYQYAARYGSSKMGYLYEAVATHSGGTPKVGLNYLQWIELGNEPNGEDQNGTTPYQLAALTSAAYDGHQRTILSDVWNGEEFTYFFGAKTADPDFKVAMAGLAGIGSRYITSMVYWMKANRTDGKIAMDAFNVHTYFGQYFTLNGQQICVGVSPEQFGLVDAMAGLVEYRDKYYPDVEVWLTEFGWDTNQSYETMTSAHAYADYSGREVQAMWLARAYLLLAASGVDKATMYMVEDGTDDRTAVGKYGTCGIFACDVEDVVDPETGEVTTIYNDGMIAKESYYILYTLKDALGDMRFNREISSGNPDVWIYEFTGDNGERGYAVWCPTSNDTRVENFQLYINADNATLITNNFEDHREYKDQYGNPTNVDLYYQTTGDRSELSANNGFVSVNVSENPIYVIVND